MLPKNLPASYLRECRYERYEAAADMHFFRVGGGFPFSDYTGASRPAKAVPLPELRYKAAMLFTFGPSILGPQRYSSTFGLAGECSEATANCLTIDNFEMNCLDNWVG